MNPRYCVSISISEGRQFMKLHFGDRATIPHGSRCMWVAGVQYVTDQPGVYLVGAAGGLEGVCVQVIAPVVAEAKAS